MSDEEEVYSEEEAEEEEVEIDVGDVPKVTTIEIDTEELDDESRELLETNMKNRQAMVDEINSMKVKSAKRKIEREREEKRMAKQRAEEESRRKAEEEERKRKKEEEDAERRAAKAEKMAEFEKQKEGNKPNFKITKKAGGPSIPSGDGEGDEQEEKKSKEQLEAEKKAILSQRIHPLNVDGFDASKLQDKARELHNHIYRLESERYDLEKRFKEQQYDLMELAERARSMNKVGRDGLKRVQLGNDEIDKIQEKYSGAPSRVEMFSKYERQKDKRTYGDKRVIFTGPSVILPPERIKPKRAVEFKGEGMPVYKGMGEDGAPPPKEVAAEDAGEEEE